MQPRVLRERGVRRLLHPPQPFDDEKTVLQRAAHIRRVGREGEVEQNQIRFVLAYHTQGFRSVGGRRHLIPPGGQLLQNGFQNDLVVVHHQNLFGARLNWIHILGWI